MKFLFLKNENNTEILIFGLILSSLQWNDINNTDKEIALYIIPLFHHVHNILYQNRIIYNFDDTIYYSWICIKYTNILTYNCIYIFIIIFNK